MSQDSLLRILHLEDEPKDAELVQAALEAEGIASESVRVRPCGTRPRAGRREGDRDGARKETHSVRQPSVPRGSSTLGPRARVRGGRPIARRRRTSRNAFLQIYCDARNGNYRDEPGAQVVPAFEVAVGHYG